MALRKLYMKDDVYEESGKETEPQLAVSGRRVNRVYRSISRHLTIRKFNTRHFEMQDLIAAGTLDHFLTVARFQGMTEFFDCLACALLCLLDFRDVSSCFGESLFPSQRTAGAMTRNREECKEGDAPRSERAPRLSDTGFFVARKLLVQTVAGIRQAGRGTLKEKMGTKLV